MDNWYTSNSGTKEVSFEFSGISEISESSFDFSENTNPNMLPLDIIFERGLFRYEVEENKTETNLLIFADLSASQLVSNADVLKKINISSNETNKYTILEFLIFLLVNYTSCYFSAFGSENIEDVVVFNPEIWSNDYKHLAKQWYAKKLFDATSPNMIGTALQAIDQTKKNCLVFQGDGNFYGKKTFTQVLSENIHLIQNASMLIIVFSEWTQQHVQEKLFNEISALVESVASAMPPPIRFVMTFEDCYSPVTAQKVLDCIQKTGYVYKTDEYGFSSFVLKRSLTPKKLQKLSNICLKLIILMVNCLLIKRLIF